MFSTLAQILTPFFFFFLSTISTAVEKAAPAARINADEKKRGSDHESSVFKMFVKVSYRSDRRR